MKKLVIFWSSNWTYKQMRAIHLTDWRIECCSSTWSWRRKSLFQTRKWHLQMDQCQQCRCSRHNNLWSTHCHQQRQMQLRGKSQGRIWHSKHLLYEYPCCELDLHLRKWPPRRIHSRRSYQQRHGLKKHQHRICFPGCSMPHQGSTSTPWCYKEMANILIHFDWGTKRWYLYQYLLTRACQSLDASSMS